MKYLILTDTHFGARKDDEVFMSYFTEFLDTEFFPYIEKYNITEVIHAGDVFDKRTSVNINTITWARKNFFDRLQKLGVTLHVVIGNHDTYFKNTNSVNSPKVLLKDYPNVRIYERPTEYGPFLFVPWITTENRKETLQAITKTANKYVIGHLELQGYKMYEGAYCTNGTDPNIFAKFEMVMSGHFHAKNSAGNVHFLGCPWDLMVNDVYDVKGFHRFDADDPVKLEFIANPKKMYIRLEYDDTRSKKYTIEELQKYEHRYLHVDVRSKLDPIKFDKFCEVLANSNPLGIKYNDYTLQQLNVGATGLANLSDDILTMIKKSLEEDYDKNLLFDARLKPDLETLLNDLYTEAIAL